MSFVQSLDKCDMYTAEAQKIFTFSQLEYGDLYQAYGIESPSDFRQLVYDPQKFIPSKQYECGKNFSCCRIIDRFNQTCVDADVMSIDYCRQN